MIGHVIMEIEANEMRAAVAYYLNKDVFDANSIRERHKAVVTDVRQRDRIQDFDERGPTLAALSAEINFGVTPRWGRAWVIG